MKVGGAGAIVIVSIVIVSPATKGVVRSLAMATTSSLQPDKNEKRLQGFAKS
jgi:hypothetical protein